MSTFAFLVITGITIVAAIAGVAVGLLADRAGRDIDRIKAREAAEATVRRDAFENGHAAGLADGLDEGRRAGFIQGKQQAATDCEAKGYQVGQVDGKRIGRAEALMKAYDALDTIARTD